VKKKLGLRTETLCALSGVALSGVAGGVLSGDNTVKRLPESQRCPIGSCFCPPETWTKTAETTKLTV